MFQSAFRTAPFNTYDQFLTRANTHSVFFLFGGAGCYGNVSTNYMNQYNENIGEMERFDANNYPEMIAELSLIINGTRHIPVYYKKDIIISYLRDHSIINEWIIANPVLITLMLSGSLSTVNIEKLFELCRWNKSFRKELEVFLAERLNQ